MLHTDHEKLCVEHINLKLVLHYTFRTSYVLVHSLYHHQYRRSRTIYCATAMNGVEGATNNLHFYLGILTTINFAATYALALYIFALHHSKDTFGITFV